MAQLCLQVSLFMRNVISPRFQDHFQKLNQLSTRGKYGATFKCIHKITSEIYVVKEINKNKFYRIPQKYRSRYLRAMRDELDIIASAPHSNIVSIVDNIYEDENFMYIVMNECKGGNLYQRIIQKGQWTERDIAKVIKQLLKALKFMHEENQIVHCNLKPEKILFVDKSNNSRLNIIDFGFSKVVPRLKHLSDLQTTPYYTSPEIIRDKQYRHSSDIWSVGVIAYVMLFGYPPFYVDPVNYGKHERKQLFRKIKRGFIARIRSTAKYGFGPWFPDHLKVSKEARDFVSKLLSFNTTNRYTANEALLHPWISENKVSVSLNIVDSLTTFMNTCRYKLYVINVFQERFAKMKPTDFMQLECIFNKIDRNKDGIISLKQFKNGISSANIQCILSSNIQSTVFHFGAICTNYWFRLTNVNYKKYNLDFLYNLVDEYIYGKQNINYNDLLTALVHDYLVYCDQILYDSFCKLDDDNDGKITINELKNALKEYDPLAQYDRNVEILDSQYSNSSDLCGVIEYEQFLLCLHPSFEDLHWIPQAFKKMKSIFPNKKKKQHSRRKKSNK